MKKKRNLTACTAALCATLILCAMLALPVSAADSGANIGTYANESIPDAGGAADPAPRAEENGSVTADGTDGTAGGGGHTEDEDTTDAANEAGAADGTAGGGGAYEKADSTADNNESSVTDGTAGGGGHTEDEGTNDAANESGAADGTAGGGGAYEKADSTADNNESSVADGTAGGAGLGTENGTNTPATDADESIDTNAADSNGFSVLLEGVRAHFGEIFSALAFVGSIIVMVCYKSGLLPVIKEGLRQLAGGVRGLGEHTVTIREDTAELRAAMERELEAAEGVLTKMADTLESLEKKLGDEEARDREISVLKEAVSCEIDMLYNVFMAAAMPQYLKEQLGESVAGMKAMLKAGGTDEGKD